MAVPEYGLEDLLEHWELEDLGDYLTELDRYRGLIERQIGNGSRPSSVIAAAYYEENSDETTKSEVAVEFGTTVSSVTYQLRQMGFESWQSR